MSVFRGFECVFYSSFFFSYSGDIQVLHSFPTRRSSDLGLSFRERTSMPRKPLPLNSAAWPSTQTIPALPHYQRSEEHTSELQSHSELVCRLLLEKKKETELRAERQREGIAKAKRAGVHF